MAGAASGRCDLLHDRARTTCGAFSRIPTTMIGSDGLPHDQHPHPRLWGTFPRVLGHYVRDVKLFPLEEAVRRMTGAPRPRSSVSKIVACCALVLTPI